MSCLSVCLVNPQYKCVFNKLFWPFFVLSLKPITAKWSFYSFAKACASELD